MVEHHEIFRHVGFFCLGRRGAVTDGRFEEVATYMRHSPTGSTSNKFNIHLLLAYVAGFPNYDLEKTMPMQEAEKQHRDREKLEGNQRSALIGKNVLRALGQPSDLHEVQVRQLWEDHYRANVFVGVDAASTKVAHSYFLVVGSDGHIIASTPAIAKEY